MTNDKLQFIVWEIHNENAVTPTSLNILRAATGCISIGVTQQGVQADVEPSKCIHNSIVTGVDNHGGL